MKNITGNKYNHLTAIEFIKIKNSCEYWLFECDCGNRKIMRVYDVINNNSKGCGCLINSHKMSRNRFYIIYYSMLARCNKTNTINYYLYGGRGIKCLWKSFEEFRDDMYKNYLEHCKQFGKKNTQIDRIDNNEHYCKKNCRWVTAKQQQRNKRNNRLLTYEGQTKCLTEWAEILKISKKTLESRLNLYQWSVERALSTPVR